MFENDWALRYDNGDLHVITCRVPDAPEPFETSVKHPEFNEERWIIVECYKTQDRAEAGHYKWLRTMTDSPPEVLHEVGESPIARMLDKFYGDRGWRTMVRIRRP